MARGLTRRERQVMDLLYRERAATAAEVQGGMPNAPSYSAVRALLATMERKGLVEHVQDGVRYVYSPVVPAEDARRGALRRLVDSFFDGSPGAAALALLGGADQLDDAELDALEALVARAREEGR